MFGMVLSGPEDSLLDFQITNFMVKKKSNRFFMQVELWYFVGFPLVALIGEENIQSEGHI